MGYVTVTSVLNKSTHYIMSWQVKMQSVYSIWFHAPWFFMVSSKWTGPCVGHSIRITDFTQFLCHRRLYSDFSHASHYIPDQSPILSIVTVLNQELIIVKRCVFFFLLYFQSLLSNQNSHFTDLHSNSFPPPFPFSPLHFSIHSFILNS